MHLLGYIVIALARVLGLVINLYTFVIVAAVFVSWVNADPYNPIVKILRQLTEPVFRIVRRVLPAKLRYARLDISPIIVLVGLILIDTILNALLFDLGRSLLAR